MTATTAATTVGSLKHTSGMEPWTFYEQVRELGDLVWDEEMNGWLITSYDLIKEVGRADEELWRSPFTPNLERPPLGMDPDEWAMVMGVGSKKHHALLEGP